MEFVKSHGLGNDYLVIAMNGVNFELTPGAIRRICDRHTGIGADGILVPVESPRADFGVRILNPDGSEAEKSGNGLRIFSKFLYDHGRTRERRFTVATLGGVVHVRLLPDEGDVRAVRVDMGEAACDDSPRVLEVAGRRFDVMRVSVGNPHAVIVVPELVKDDLLHFGPLVENHPMFPHRTNVQFAKVISPGAVGALIWERGAGYTLASGSSASAVAVACFRQGLVDRSVTVHMEGGDLDIAVEPDMKVIMTGPAEEICAGAFSADFMKELRAL